MQTSTNANFSKHVVQLIQAAKMYMTIHPELSRHYMFQAVKLAKNSDMDCCALQKEACQHCYTVFVPGVTCSVSSQLYDQVFIKDETQQQIVMNWSLANKQPHTISHVHARCNSVMVYECKHCSWCTLFPGAAEKKRKKIRSKQPKRKKSRTSTTTTPTTPSPGKSLVATFLQQLK